MYQLCTSTTWIKVYVNFVRFIHLLFFFHHLHDNRFWGERFLIEMIIFANFKTWKEPPEITNLHIIWFIQFDISRRIKIDKKKSTTKQTNKQTNCWLLKEDGCRLYMCLDRPTTIQSECSFYKHSQKIRRFFFSSPTTKRPWFTVRSSSANFRDSYEELLVEKTVFCIAMQFKDSYQFVLFVCLCHIVDFEFTGWV